MGLLTDLLGDGNATSDLIEEQILASAAATITFSAIAADYSDLIVSAMVRTDRASTSDVLYMRCNGDSTPGNYDYSRITSDGSTVATLENTSQSYAVLGDIYGDNAAASRYSPVTAHLGGYKSTTFIKVFQSEASRVTDGFGVWTSSWKSTAAITSLTFGPAVGTNLLAGSEFRLYGVR